MKRIRELVRLIVIRLRYFVLIKVYGMNIHPTARISWGARLDKTNPSGIYIGEESYVASGAIVLSHDFTRAMKKDTVIGRRCFIGVNALVMCGVRIGDNVVVGAGSVVTKDVPTGCIVAGNPARIIRDGIWTKKYGQLDIGGNYARK